MGRRRRRRRNTRGPSSSVRVTRTRGGTTSSRTGGLSITGMSPTGRTSGSQITISATVRAAGTSLSKGDIKLYLDGSEKTRFHYDEASGRLSYYVGRSLPSGAHRVEIQAEASSGDSQGRVGGTARKSWTFNVMR